MTLKDTPNATFLLVSEDGQSPSDLQDGLTTDLFGQVVPPASPLPHQENTRGEKTSGTFSQPGSASSASVALQQSLANNLQMQLPKGGLTMFIKGWSKRHTPLGQQYCQLVASGRHTCEIDFGLWPTPRCKGEEGCLTVYARKGDMQVMQHNLTSAAQAALWITPTSRDWKDTIGMVAQRKDGKQRIDQLPRQVFGTVLQQYPVTTGKCDLLNPAFPCWLMGFSTAALSSMQSAMQSFRKLPRNSSKQ